MIVLTIGACSREIDSQEGDAGKKVRGAVNISGLGCPEGTHPEDGGIASFVCEPTATGERACVGFEGNVEAGCTVALKLKQTGSCTAGNPVRIPKCDPTKYWIGLGAKYSTGPMCLDDRRWSCEGRTFPQSEPLQIGCILCVPDAPPTEESCYEAWRTCKAKANATYNACTKLVDDFYSKCMLSGAAGCYETALEKNRVCRATFEAESARCTSKKEECLERATKDLTAISF